MSVEAVGIKRRLERVYYALRNYRWLQILLRLASPLLMPMRMFVYSCLKLCLKPPDLSGKTPILRARCPARSQSTMQELRDQRYYCISRSLQVEDSDPWRSVEISGFSPLWKFNAHYHEFLIECLNGADSKSDFDLIQSTLQLWLKRFPEPTRETARLAWHPYCISRRLPAWFELMQRLDLPNELKQEMARSIQRQALWLALNLELDLGGNHLWENVKALSLALNFRFKPLGGRFWHSALLSVVKRQLLRSGEHFERSPMYQAILSEGLRQVISTLPNEAENLKAELEHEQSRMDGFLRFISNSNGQYPLFGDSTYDAPLPVPGPQTTSDDYRRFATKSYLLVVDLGPVAAKSLPAHGHADLGTFEVFQGDRRFIVDTGVSEYTGPRRDYERSSAAHNGITVCDEIVADTYGSFRMGFSRKFDSIVDHCEGSLTWVEARRFAKCRHGNQIVRNFWGKDDSNDAVFLGGAISASGDGKLSRKECARNLKFFINCSSFPVQLDQQTWLCGNTFVHVYSEVRLDHDFNQLNVSERFNELQLAVRWTIALQSDCVDASILIACVNAEDDNFEKFGFAKKFCSRIF